MLSQREPNIGSQTLKIEVMLNLVVPVCLIEEYCYLGAADIIKTVVTISPFAAINPSESEWKNIHCFEPILANFVTTILPNFHREWKIINFEHDNKIGIMVD